MNSGKVFFILIFCLIVSCTNISFRENRLFDDNSLIATKIKKHLLENKSLKFSSIHVKTNENIVELTGIVHSSYQKEKAGQIAATIEGVEQVHNFLTIIPNNKKPLN